MISTHKMDILQKTKSFDKRSIADHLREPKDFALILNGKTEFSIIKPSCCGEYLSSAVEFLRVTLNKIAGSEIFFYSSHSERTISFQILEDDKKIKYDGFCIEAQKNKISFLALSQRGAANGIYRFLEDYLGCMFVRPDYDYIPQCDTVYLYEGKKISNPDFRWRRFYQYELSQNNWYRKLLSNGTDDTLWGNSCHTVFDYVNPDIYFEKHPEYFSLYNGERTKDQLCLCNEDIYPIISESADKMIKCKPEAVYWDFSINDNLHGCQCEKCRAISEKYGGFAPTLLILNKLAKEHPDKIFSTLAYFFSAEPPRSIPCEKNINVKLAPISSGQKYAFAFSANKKAADTNKLISDWSEVISDLYLWDYVVNFKHALLPYPNFDVQRDNLRFYKQHNVTHIFHQGCRDKGAELACLRSYIMSRQLWDIEVDTDSLIAKYLCVTYGAAAPYLAQYLQLMHDILRQEADDLDLYDNPKDHASDYLSTGAIEKYRQLIDEAFKAEKDDKAIISRLEEIKINVLYAQINDVNASKEDIKKYIDEIKPLIEKHQIDRYNEWNKPALKDLYEQNDRAIKFRDTAL